MDAVVLYQYQLLVFLTIGARCRLYRDGHLQTGQLAYSGAYNLRSSPHARSMRGNAVGGNAVASLYKGPRLDIELGTSQLGSVLTQPWLYAVCDVDNCARLLACSEGQSCSDGSLR